ncbi:hypothetical protein V493_01163 [Pseudogymnoascus sp. VKM F-4281 (FW-2241)]|nr:hypothetical protein V493_01163 [Pseudogymnoascus sp. VKM F-4281 (FW-2241)]
MLLNTILVPLSAILAIVSAMPAGTSLADFDEGQIIDLNSWVPQGASDVPEVSPRDVHYLTPVKCGTGKDGSSNGIAEWFTAAGARESCIQNGDMVTWSRGNDRFKAVNRSGVRRCIRFSMLLPLIKELGYFGDLHCGGKSVWGGDGYITGITYGLWSV